MRTAIQRETRRDETYVSRRPLPSAGLQFFGMAKINSKNDVMTVSLHNLQRERTDTVDLPPEG